MVVFSIFVLFKIVINHDSDRNFGTFCSYALTD
nr:MAG TPA: hypothetical protein [Caudoviricetes sp.]